MSPVRLALAWCAGFTLSIGLGVPSFAAPPGRLRTPGEVGTVDTVAGPGFCGGPAKPDPASSRVGDLAGDTGGTLWFESGAAGEGVVTKVISTASVLVTRTGVPVSGQGGGDREGASRPRLASASRLAADRGNALLIAAPTAVLRLAEGLETVAGTRSPAGGEAAGDGGPLRDARFTHITAMTSDSAGNVYVADEIGGTGGEFAIRFLNRSEEPITFYTGASQQLAVTPGTVKTIADSRSFDRPLPGPRLMGQVSALAVVGDRLYVGATLPESRSRAVVHLLNLGGDPLALHGATVAPAAMAAVANVAEASQPAAGSRPRAVAPVPGIAADDEGNLFLAEPANHRVRRVDPAGRVTIFAGTGVAGFAGNDGAATHARLNGPYDVAVGPGGRVYISDAGNGQVRVVDQGGTIRATLGNGATSAWVCGTAATTGATGAGGTTSHGGPVSLAADSTGNVYLAASGLGQVHRLAPSGSLHPVAGRPATSCPDRNGCPVADDAAPNSAALARLSALAPGPAGGLYVLEDARIRFLNLTRRSLEIQGVSVAPAAMRTVLGEPPAAKVPPPTTPPASGPLTPEEIRERHLAAQVGVHYTALAADQRGNLLVAEMPNGTLERGSVGQVRPGASLITLVSPPNERADGTIDTSRCCPRPADLTADRAGNLYIADVVTRRVWFLNRSITPVTVHGVVVPAGAVEAVAGAASAGALDEGARALDAQLSRPSGMALDGAGNLYVTDSSENSVRRVDPDGIITTVIGTGQPGFNGDGLRGRLTALDRPTDVVVDTCGNLLVADTGNDRVRRLNLVSSCPTVAATTAGAARRLSAGAVPLSALAVVGAVGVGIFARHRSRRQRRRVDSRAAGQLPG
ncbi:MAG: hypothetical protein KY447_09805 [Actinobacteria bacterium]|nr:hypothetical protein [Actinomycetota bacterium]